MCVKYFIPVQIADETNIIHVIIQGILGVSELRECIDNYTEYDIHEDYIKNYPVNHVIYHPYIILLSIFFDIAHRFRIITHPCSHSDPLKRRNVNYLKRGKKGFDYIINRRHETMIHGVAKIFPISHIGEIPLRFEKKETDHGKELDEHTGKKHSR